MKEETMPPVNFELLAYTAVSYVDLILRAPGDRRRLEYRSYTKMIKYWPCQCWVCQMRNPFGQMHVN